MQPTCVWLGPNGLPVSGSGPTACHMWLGPNGLPLSNRMQGNRGGGRETTAHYIQLNRLRQHGGVL